MNMYIRDKSRCWELQGKAIYMHVTKQKNKDNSSVVKGKLPALYGIWTHNTYFRGKLYTLWKYMMCMYGCTEQIVTIIILFLKVYTFIINKLLIYIYMYACIYSYNNCNVLYACICVYYVMMVWWTNGTKHKIVCVYFWRVHVWYSLVRTCTIHVYVQYRSSIYIYMYMYNVHVRAFVVCTCTLYLPLYNMYSWIPQIARVVNVLVALVEEGKVWRVMGRRVRVKESWLWMILPLQAVPPPLIDRYMYIHVYMYVCV